MKSFFFSFLLCGLAAFSTGAPFANAQNLSTSLAWQIKFPKAIEWYVRTSAGVLLVRSGRSLTAIDGVSGKQLWKMDHLNIESKMGQGSVGGNILEIPGISILLINGAKLPQDKKTLLIGVDLWTGAILWRKPAVEDLVQLIPFYGTGKVLLVTASYDKAINTAITLAIIASDTAGLWAGTAASGAIDLAAFAAQEGNNGTAGLRYHPVLQSLDPTTGAMDWTTEYPRSLRYGFLTFRLLEGQLYLQAFQSYLGGIESIRGRVDLISGNREWDTVEKYNEQPDLMPELQSSSGRLIFAAEDVESIDTSAGSTVWKSEKMGRVANVILRHGTIIGSGGKAVFALDETTGAPRWSLAANGKPTNVLAFDEEDAVAFCDKSNLVVVDDSTGKVVRETPLEMKKPPRAVVKIGKKFLLAVAPGESSLYEVNTGQKLWSAGQFDGAFPDVNFLVAHTPLGGPGWLPEDDMRRQITQGWDKIEQITSNDPAAGDALKRLQPFLDDPETRPEILYLSVQPGDSAAYDIFRIDTETGEKHEYGDFLGAQPDASVSFGLMFSIDTLHDPDNRTLTAYTLQPN
jgi:outer membrane protein assembly factor BamB